MEGNIEERMSVFLASLHTPPDGFLGKLRERAVSDGVPIIRLQMESLLQVLLAAKQPKRILEVGTAVGYSALLMAEHTKDCSITTIEKDPVRVRSAKENFAMHPEGGRITLLEGDAQQLLQELAISDAPRFDFIFMDAAKGQYLHFLPHVLALLEPGGMLVSDNVLQEGDILESHYIVERRNRTIYKRMRAYLYELTHNPALTTTVLGAADGVAISVRKDEDFGNV